MFEVEILVLKLKEGKTIEYLHYKELRKFSFILWLTASHIARLCGPHLAFGPKVGQP